ncbi:hypothetical protein IWX47DRAFT_20846 [Phyllosticta citricarpa]
MWLSARRERQRGEKKKKKEREARECDTPRLVSDRRQSAVQCSAVQCSGWRRESRGAGKARGCEGARVRGRNWRSRVCCVLPCCPAAASNGAGVRWRPRPVHVDLDWNARRRLHRTASCAVCLSCHLLESVLVHLSIPPRPRPRDRQLQNPHWVLVLPSMPSLLLMIMYVT